MARKRLAFTLVELLVCVGILALLAGLLFPVMARAKREGYKANATAKLHNVGVALLMYHDANNGWPLYTLDPLFDAGYLTDPNYLLEPAVDPYPQGYAKARLECNTALPSERLDTPSRPTSYDDVFLYDIWDRNLTQRLLAQLEDHDPNPGLVVIRVFGEDVKPSTSCHWADVRYMGETIRVRMDGSVKRGRYRAINPSNGDYSFCEIAPFTDLSPETVCNYYFEPDPGWPFQSVSGGKADGR